jgi:ribonuclease D
LLQLRDRLFKELAAQDRLDEARSAFDRVAQSEWAGRPFDPEGFWRIKGTRGLDDTSLAVLRALYIYRDQRAQARDRPPFKVLSNRALIDLSQQAPRSLSELGRIRGLPRHLSHRARRKLLSVIEQGLRDGPPQKPAPQNNRPDRKEIDRYEALRQWRNQQAQQRGVEPDVVLSNRTLHILAQHNPTSSEALNATRALSDWERQKYGREIIAQLRRQRRFPRPGLRGKKES